MINRFKPALEKLLNFVQNPVDHLVNDKSTYAQLREITSVIVFIGIALEALKALDDRVLFGAMLLLAVLLAWPLSWVLLNVGAVIFEYYLEWVAYKQIIRFQPNLLLTQRIMAYSSISFLFSALPGEYLGYLGGLVSLALTALGLKTVYKIKLDLGIGLVIAYNLLIFAIILIAVYSIKLLV